MYHDYPSALDYIESAEIWASDEDQFELCDKLTCMLSIEELLYSSDTPILIDPLDCNIGLSEMQIVQSQKVNNSINASTNLTKVKVHPNPSTSILKVSFENVQFEEADLNTVQISVFDLTGRMIKNEILNSSYLLNISELSNGTYILKAHLPDGSIVSEKFIVHNE